MPVLVEPALSLGRYLEAEEKAIEESKHQWNQEFRSFCELADLYDRLKCMMRINSQEILAPAKLFLVVQTQMYGVASQLLRRRLVDAEMLTRRAIEAAATAYRVWKYPGLTDIFYNAYPNANQTLGNNQWQRSREYRREFSTDKLFGENGKTWRNLQSLFSMFSALSSHAGPGALISHKTRDQLVTLHFFETDDKITFLSWNYMFDCYWEILKVFVEILGKTAEETMRNTFATDALAWRKRTEQVATKRAPEWIKSSSVSADAK
jgi:hypothetical protein